MNALVDLAAEAAYVGACLLHGLAFIAAHRVNPDDLSSRRLELILAALQACAELGEVDTVQLRAELRRRGTFHHAGGDEQILALTANATDQLMTEAKGRSLASRLKDLARARRLLAELDRARAHLGDGAIDDGVRVARAAVEVLDSRAAVPVESIADGAKHLVRDILAREGREAIHTVPSGIDSIDDVITGLDPGSLTVVGGGTGVGKSSLAIMAMMNRGRVGARHGYVSCEDAAGVVRGRLLAQIGGPSPALIRQIGSSREGVPFRMPEASARALFDAAEVAQTILQDTSYQIGSDENEVIAAMGELVRRGCVCLWVDYLQTIRSSQRLHTRAEAVSHVASRLKRAAARLSVPLVLFSQFSRQEKGAPRKPRLYDFKETGDLENMADYAILLWRSEKDPSFVFGELAKSKSTIAGRQFGLARSASGALREISLMDPPPSYDRSEFES